MRRGSLLLFVAYAAWSIAAVVEIVWRRHHGHSPWPAWLADHNGNLAVSGFILAAAFPGAGLAQLGRRFASQVLSPAGHACVPLAATAFGTFFVSDGAPAPLPPNVADWRDIPASLFGRRSQQHLERALAPRNRASRDVRPPRPQPSATVKVNLYGSSEFEGWTEAPGRATPRIGYMHPDGARRQPLESWMAAGGEAYETLVIFPPDADGLRWHCLQLDDGHYFEFQCERVDVVDIDDAASPPTA